MVVIGRILVVPLGTSSSTWTNYYIPISNFAEHTVQLAFYFKSIYTGSFGSASSGWYIDDVSLVTGPLVFNNPEDFESGMGITGNNYDNVQDWVIDTNLQHGGLYSIHNPYNIDDDNVLFMLGTFDFLEYEATILSPTYPERAKKLDDYDYLNIYILAPEDLIVSKIIRLSKKDLSDIEILLKKLKYHK